MTVEVTPYELVVRSQAGAEDLLRDIGALAQIEEALLGHCEANQPEPLYRPQEYKERLAVHGWIPEERSLVRILDAILWLAHPAAGNTGAKRVLACRMEGIAPPIRGS